MTLLGRRGGSVSKMLQTLLRTVSQTPFPRPSSSQYVVCIFTVQVPISLCTT